MSILNEPQGAAAAESHYADELPVRRKQPGNVVIKWLTTTDHKTIGTLYLVTSFAFFLIGGVMALLMRAELARPGLQILSSEQFNQAFTMHGTIMLLMFATPLFAGFTNWIMPLQIGAPDVAFPRLNMFAYWLYLFGSTIAVGGFLTPQGAADFGWFAYSPLSDAVRSPGIGADMWIMGLAFSGFGTILGAVNFITTIICMRAPGMTMFRMPIFVWNVLLTAVLVLLAFPSSPPRSSRWRRIGNSGHMSSTLPTAVRCCGNTSSGSSAIQRCTSSRCRSSASSPRSSRSSPASRCSVTWDWSPRPSPSLACP